MARDPGEKKDRSRLDRLVTRYREAASIAAPLKGVRAYANWARANYEMWRATDTVRARPLKLTFDPTNVCQLRCPLCPTGLRIQDRDPMHARLHIFEHLIEEVGDYVFFIDFYNWGEPLLNLHLEDMVALAARKKIVTYVSSNLSLQLSDERIRKLMASGLSELICSLDGASQQTYGTYRRNGDFAVAHDNLRRIVRAKRELGVKQPAVVWRFYVFRFNEHEIAEARALAEDAGVDRFVLGTPYLDEGRFPLSPDDRKAMQSWASTNPAFNRYDPQHPEHVDPKAPVEVRSRCDWHYVSTAINPDGAVSPCCAVFERTHDFGRLEEAGVSRPYMEVINNERFRAVRARFAGRRAEPTGLICETCPTPDIMSYGQIMNRHIAFFTMVSLLESLRRPFRSPRRGAPIAAGPPVSVTR
jgi:MoaA/NifB/PqqE/SkfB family radical SAM enzyme